MSGGRLEIGVGAGGKQRPFAAFDADPATFIARFTEGVRLMKACWTEPEITFDGRFWQLREAGMEPKPFQKPFPPLWFGGGHPNALRRGVRLGGGFFGAGSSTTAQFRRQVSDLRTILAEEGRDPARSRSRSGCTSTSTKNAARAQQTRDRGTGSASMTMSGPTSRRSRCSATPMPASQGVRDVIDAGAEMILFTPLHDEAAQMERVAARSSRTSPEADPLRPGRPYALRRSPSATRTRARTESMARAYRG